MPVSESTFGNVIVTGGPCPVKVSVSVPFKMKSPFAPMYQAVMSLSNSAHPQNPPPPPPHSEGLLQFSEIPIWYTAAGPYAFAAGAENATTVATSSPTAGTTDSTLSFFIAPPRAANPAPCRAEPTPNLSRGRPGTPPAGPEL